MFMGKILVGLDIAGSMGVVYNNFGSGVYNATTYVGTPIEQLQMLEDVLGDLTNVIVFFEQLNTFVNANTTRSLLHRVGYIKNGLIKLGVQKIEPVNAMAARKFLGFKNKKQVGAYFKDWGLNQDEADAMAVLLYAKAEPLELLTEDSIKCLR